MLTRQQERAKRAMELVSEKYQQQEISEEYASFAKSFPALLHNCGLVQSLSFAERKQQDYFLDLARVMDTTKDSLGTKSRESSTPEYQYLSREARYCSEWIKRYVEASSKDHSKS